MTDRLPSIWYHAATNEYTAISILRSGFPPGTRFCPHLEDVVGLGQSVYVFEVMLRAAPGLELQAVAQVPVEAIVSYRIFNISRVVDWPLRRSMVEGTNRSALEKMEQRWGERLKLVETKEKSDEKA